jgi:nitrogen-specific signal transduction histidine kinase
LPYLSHFVRVSKVVPLLLRLCPTKGENTKRMSDEENQATVVAKTEQLRSLVAEYETRIDEIAELVAQVRHEINNPLTGVLGQAQLLLREELSDNARKRAKTIEELAMRIREIVARLRQIQRPARVAEQQSGAESDKA